MSKQHKDLNENELAGAITDQLDHIKPHLPKILIGIAAIAVIVFGINYVISSRSSAKEAKSINLVLFGVENSASGSLATLDRQIEDYPDAQVTAWAYLLKGDRELTSGLEKIFVDRLAGREFIQRSIKSFEEANKLSDDNSMIAHRANFGLARAFESLGQFDDAAVKFAELAKDEDSPFGKLAQKGLVRVNNPANREFYTLFEEKENNSLEETSSEPAPETNTGLPPRPDFTYPGEEALLGIGGGGPTSEPGSDETKKDDATEKTDPSAKQEAPPMPSEDVLGNKTPDKSKQEKTTPEKESTEKKSTEKKPTDQPKTETTKSEKTEKEKK